MLSQSSLQSPMSPSSSVGPDYTQGGLPLLEVPPPLPDDLSHSLMGISPRMPNENHINDLGEFSFDDVLGTSPMGQYPLGAPQVDAPCDLLERLGSELEKVGATIQELVAQPVLPQLYDMKDLLKRRFSRFETAIQTKIEREEHSSFSCKLKDRYLCKICPYGERKVYTSRGTFKRHISVIHYPRYQFRCPIPACPWTSYRRDKVHEHLRGTHGITKKLRRDQINRLETRVPPPMNCELCSKPVDGWEEYFKCISEHCRLREDDSADTSASQSRRSSGDSGSGANGGSGNFNGGGYLGGSQNIYPFGGGSGQMNGGSFYSNTDQQYFSQASSYSNEMDSSSLTGQSPPGAMGSGSPRPVSFSRQTFHPSVFKQQSMTENISGETGISPDHRQSLRRSATESLNSMDIDSDGHSSFKKSRSKIRSVDDHFRVNHLRSVLQRHLQRPDPPASDVGDEKECKTCGHDMSDCTSCHLLQLNVDKCHLCTDGSCQKAGLETQQLPNCWLQEAATDADGMTAEGVTMQVSDKSLQEVMQGTEADEYSELTENSRRISDDAVNSPEASSKRTVHPSLATKPTDDHISVHTGSCDTFTPSSLDSPLSMLPISKHQSPSTRDVRNSGFQQQQKSQPETSLLSYSLPVSKPSGNPPLGLGIYGYRRPSFSFNGSSAVEMMLPNSAPPGGCLKQSPGTFLSTESNRSTRHGRAKLSRSCGSNSSVGLRCLRHSRPPKPSSDAEPKDLSQDRDAKSIDLITQSFFAGNQSEHPDHPLPPKRPAPTKHILSRKKYDALRTKLQVIVEILALGRSSKAPILAPEESNTSYLKSIVPTASYLKSPVFDFDLSCLDIHSSLPLLLDTFLLQTDPKGHTSAKLTDYIYDADDEMHLMLIYLIPLLMKFLRIPTHPIDAAAAGMRIEI